MKKTIDVTALGELLIDFTAHGTSEQGNPLLEANPGGAPCNVLAMLQKLGKSTAFVGKVGKDGFGRQLRLAVEAAGIDTSGLCWDDEIPTTLAVVHTLPGGDREFSFYRKPGADIDLRADELKPELLENCRIFHFGTLSLTDEPCRSATIKAYETAKAAGALISFDPNLREPLWPDLEAAREAICWGLERCDVLKISDNEILFMTGEADFDKAAAILRAKYPNIKLMNVTAGKDGSISYYKDLRVFQPGCPLGGTVETTGAGDTFCACALNYVLDHGLEDLSEEDLGQMLRFANTAAYLVTTRKGALRSMPNLDEIEQTLARY